MAHQTIEYDRTLLWEAVFLGLDEIR